MATGVKWIEMHLIMHWRLIWMVVYTACCYMRLCVCVQYIIAVRWMRGWAGGAIVLLMWGRIEQQGASSVAMAVN